MLLRDRDQDTICAVSTPAGIGGLAVIRISGPDAGAIAQRIAPFLPVKLESHRAYYGISYRTLPNGKRGAELDEVIATYFQSGKSFTGEDTIEISCHGSAYITHAFLEELALIGARMADRGEFTYRAFMNGRIDLVQAEGVLALIESQSQNSARQALRQLQGSLSQQLEKHEDNLTWCLAHLEASIDFSTEGLEVVTDAELVRRTSEMVAGLDQLVQSFRAGRILKDGYRLVLTGAPNVGKSSLLNLLVGEEKAIVTEVAGTTRDLIEAAFFAGGTKVNLVDTAGLRDSEDRVEKIGIERSYAAQKEADGIFYVFDLHQGLSAYDILALNALMPEHLFLIGNKKDLASGNRDTWIQRLQESLSGSEFLQKIQNSEQFWQQRVLFVSALDHKEGERLKQVIAGDLETKKFEDQAVIFQARHFENLSRALENLNRAKGLIEQGTSAEFIALEMKETLLLLQETLGKRFDDQIMDRVFKEFCIGK
jgi:tRNA modification GTPase